MRNQDAVSGGFLALTGAYGNTYTGATVVNEGELDLGKSNGNALSGDLVVNGADVKLLADERSRPDNLTPPEPRALSPQPSVLLGPRCASSSQRTATVSMASPARSSSASSCARSGRSQTNRDEGAAGARSASLTRSHRVSRGGFCCLLVL